jgi:hypothetical protein
MIDRCRPMLVAVRLFCAFDAEMLLTTENEAMKTVPP